MENMLGGNCVDMKKDMREHTSLQLGMLLKYLVTNMGTIPAVPKMPCTGELYSHSGVQNMSTIARMGFASG